MKKHELQRLIKIEERINKIAIEKCGLLTTDIIFEVVPARRMLEAMAYNFPTNFSHWSFGRDFDKHRTIYEHTGSGIPYEQVWNFDVPRALLVDTNPIALNILVIAHVFGHVDYFLGNRYLQHGRSSDIADEARHAAERFKKYESQFGKEWVEKIIESGLALQWHQPLDPLLEEPSEEEAREYLMKLGREQMKSLQENTRNMSKEQVEKELLKAEKRLRKLQYKTPPEPVFDILKYVIEHAPRLKPEERDILTVIRNQARALAPNRRTKMLDEGWATYWHTRIMRLLFEEGLLTAAEHGVFLEYHAKVTQASRTQLNVYNVGPAIFEYVKERWDRGQFGREYDECTNPHKRAYWNTNTDKGTEKIFQIRSLYTDRMAVEEFFTPEFIRARELYVYEQRVDEETGNTEYVIVENRPEVIQRAFKMLYALYGMTSVSVTDGNYRDKGFLLLTHVPHDKDEKLDATYRDGALERVHHVWRRSVFLRTITDEKPVLYSFNGEKHKVEEEK